LLYPWWFLSIEDLDAVVGRALIPGGLETSDAAV